MAQLCSAVGARAAVDPCSVPELQHREVPQLVTVVAAAAHVLLEEPFHLGVVEIAPTPCGRVPEDVLDPPAQFAPEPFWDGNGKSLLRSMDEVVGQAAPARELLEQPLCFAAPQLVVPGD